MNSTLAPELDRALTNLEQLQERLLQLGLRISQGAGGRFFEFDLYVVGAMKRLVSQLAAVDLLLRAGNLTCARAMLRLQIDTAMRLAAAHLAPHCGAFVSAVMKGTPVRKLRGRDGQKLTDAYLVQHLSTRRPWVKPVYESTSGFVHFSEKHMVAGLMIVDAETRVISSTVGADDWHMPMSSFLEVVECFDAATRISLEYLEDWAVAKERMGHAARHAETQAPSQRSPDAPAAESTEGG